MNYQRSYSPIRPIKSFQDLEVYQKLLAISVAIVKRIKSEKVAAVALDLPVKIAIAHSLRFSDQAKAIQMLEEIMLNCNILVVYLEQYRDLENTGNVIPGTDPGSIQIDSGSGAGMTIESEFFADHIKSILTVRGKILRLQFSWKKFSQQYKNKQNA